MKNLNSLLNQLESKIPFCEKLNLQISQSNVAWHLEHCLLVINGINKTLKNSNPTEYRWRFIPLKMIVFLINKIPRGKGKSPKTVQPQNEISQESLQKHIEISRKTIQELDSLANNTFFKHPYFGDLKRKQAIRFLEIHTKHHLSIIDDILK